MNHPTTHWVTVAFMAVVALSFCLTSTIAQTVMTDDLEVHSTTVDQRVTRHDSWDGDVKVAQASKSEWTPTDAFGKSAPKPTTDSDDWTPAKAFGQKSKADKSVSSASGEVVFHGGYVYPPGTDVSQLKPSTPKSPPTADRHPKQSEGSRSTRTASPPAKVTTPRSYAPTPLSRHSERSEESRPLADSPSASDDTTEPEAVPTPSTSAEPVEPPPADETPDEAEIDNVNTTDGWQLVATILSYGYLIAALIAAAAGIIWLLLKLEKKPTKLARKTFFVALGTCVVLWGITYTILTYILQ